MGRGPGRFYESNQGSNFIEKYILAWVPKLVTVLYGISHRKYIICPKDVNRIIDRKYKLNGGSLKGKKMAGFAKSSG